MYISSLTFVVGVRFNYNNNKNMQYILLHQWALLLAGWVGCIADEKQYQHDLLPSSKIRARREGVTFHTQTGSSFCERKRYHVTSPECARASGWHRARVSIVCIPFAAKSANQIYAHFAICGVSRLHKLTELYVKCIFKRIQMIFVYITLHVL